MVILETEVTLLSGSDGSISNLETVVNLFSVIENGVDDWVEEGIEASGRWSGSQADKSGLTRSGISGEEAEVHNEVRGSHVWLGVVRVRHWVEQLLVGEDLGDVVVLCGVVEDSVTNRVINQHRKRRSRLKRVAASPDKRKVLSV